MRSRRATEQRTPARPSPGSTAQPSSVKTKQNTAICGNVYEANNTHVLYTLRVYVCVFMGIRSVEGRKAHLESHFKRIVFCHIALDLKCGDQLCMQLHDEAAQRQQPHRQQQ
ncbi:PREDICTED: uncharacterized protein LOC108967379 [Bactrocera latifrons]|uniref:uncharacterized protein LOC108967379 n=1 Tax=Bactrocera latifrons TaxID=174628 RepID=UPI0008DE86A7|nr:PREDICTED: uncharacterized protein LOC108967379 [Bactrocera latifrons]